MEDETRKAEKRKRMENIRWKNNHPKVETEWFSQNIPG